MKIKYDSDKVFSITAFVISIATVIALIYQSNLVREQNELMQKEQYASVMPYLSMNFHGRDDDSRFELRLENNGVGPAFIQDVSIRYKDSLYHMSIIQFYNDILKVENKDHVRIVRSDIAKGSVLTANKSIPLFIIFTGQKEALKLFGAFETMEATIEITYTSIYGQKWIMKSMRELHIPIE